MIENEAVLGTNVIEVAALAVVANEADITLLAQLAVPSNEPMCDPVKEPVNGSVNTLNCVDEDIIFGGMVALAAKDAVIANDAVEGINVIDVAALAVVANEALITFCAQLAVPNVEPLCVPINEPVNDPVLT